MPSCLFCSQARSVLRYDFGPQRILRCPDCGLLYIDPLPSAEDLRAVYGADYFENAAFLDGAAEGLFGYSDYVAERFNKQPQYAAIAREVKGLLGRRERPPRLLEVGCGFGYFLDVAFEENFDVAGLEFNPFAVQRLSRKYAFPIMSGAIESAELEANAYDAIVMFDVIEHLRDPFGSLGRVWQALAPEGVLVLSTVDAESVVSRLIGKRLEDFRRTREHLVFFSRATMRRVLRAYGFETLSMRSIGHTFEIGFLLARLELYQRPLFGALRRLANRTGLGARQIYINPGTKMIVFARKAQAPTGGATSAPG